MVKYEIHEVSGGHIEVRLEGDLVIGPEASNVRECLNPLAAQFPQLTVDLARLRRIDSTGVGVLVMAHAISTGSGHRLRAVNIIGAVRDVLMLVKLLTVLGGDAEVPQTA